jgi:transposase InsO family protein
VINHNNITGVAMDNVTRIHVAWELRQAGHTAEYIAGRVGVHRVTVYRWLKGIRMHGIRGYVRYYRKAKKGCRVRKTHPYIEQRVLSLRRAYRDCCGEKLVYLLAQEGIQISRSTVYRILNKHRRLRKHHRRPQGAPLQRAERPRQVIQMDTMDLGAIYAYTAIDTFTREAHVVIRPSLQAEDGRLAMETIMHKFGWCDLLQTDGDSEFKADCQQKIYRYAAHHRIARPYKNNEQAFIESFNSTLRREEFGRTPFKAGDLDLAQQRADAFLDYYHNMRPHMSLNMQTPSQFAESYLP